MNTLKITLVILVLFSLSACSVNEKDVVGLYTIKGLSNNIDTLRILSNGKYSRVLYSRTDGRLLFQNSNEWKYVANRLVLRDYLLDEDEKHMPEETLGLGAITAFLPVKRRLSKVVIYYRNGGEDDFYYEKE